MENFWANNFLKPTTPVQTVGVVKKTLSMGVCILLFHDILYNIMVHYKQAHFLCVWGNGVFPAQKDISSAKKLETLSI